MESASRPKGALFCSLSTDCVRSCCHLERRNLPRLGPSRWEEKSSWLVRYNKIVTRDHRPGRVRNGPQDRTSVNLSLERPHTIERQADCHRQPCSQDP